MMISTRGRYALRVMIDLAEQNADGFVSLKEIAARQEISEKYLESIVKNLVQSGYLEGLRGKGGGYRLVRRPEEYSVGEILRIMEGSLAPVACLEEKAFPCNREEKCKTLPLWRKLSALIEDFLNGVTLADLVSGAPSGDGQVV